MTSYKPVHLTSVLRGTDVDLMELMRRLEEFDRNLGAILNRGILFGDNVDCASIEFTSSATANAENAVVHTLGKVPTGFIVYSLDKAATIYNGTTAHSKTTIYLKSNAASTAVKAWVF